MRRLSVWVLGVLGVGAVAAAFFLGGQLAAADLSPRPLDSMASSTAAGLQIECEPGQRAVLRQATATSAASMACVSSRTAAVSYIPASYRPATFTPSAVRTASAPRTTVSRTRSTRKSIAIVAGSTAAGAVIGGLTKGKKGAVIGGLIGGGAATIWDQVTRRRVR